jgi:hypothetical protein
MSLHVSEVRARQDKIRERFPAVADFSGDWSALSGDEVAAVQEMCRLEWGIGGQPWGWLTRTMPWRVR